ncbi:hypothetical protein, partial [Nocardia farcinica]|uniref:hypothetical protein n=1 Tax=Nocardia farcinica TaxID=37329 RepID=UPI001895B6D4
MRMTHRRRRPAAVVILLLLALVAALTACGDDKSTGVPTGFGTKGTWAEKGSATTVDSEAHDSAKISYTAWKKNRDKPSYAIVLTSEIKLPSEFDIVKSQPGLLKGYVSGYSPAVGRGLSQLQDKSVTVTVPIFDETTSSYSDDALLMSNSQILWIGSRQATSDTGVSGEGSGVMSTGRSRSLPLWNTA